MLNELYKLINNIVHYDVAVAYQERHHKCNAIYTNPNLRVCIHSHQNIIWLVISNKLINLQIKP